MSFRSILLSGLAAVAIIIVGGGVLMIFGAIISSIADELSREPGTGEMIIEAGIRRLTLLLGLASFLVGLIGVLRELGNMTGLQANRVAICMSVSLAGVLLAFMHWSLALAIAAIVVALLVAERFPRRGAE